jgi:hypothetical protein
MHDLVKDKLVSDQGKMQIAYGFAQQNSNGCDDGPHMHKPQVKQGTEHVIKEMVKMSLLRTKPKMIGGSSLNKTTRGSTFAKSLHK